MKIIKNIKNKKFFTFFFQFYKKKSFKGGCNMDKFRAKSKPLYRHISIQAYLRVNSNRQSTIQINPRTIGDTSNGTSETVHW